MFFVIILLNLIGGTIAIYGGTWYIIYSNYIRDTHISSGIHLNTNFLGYFFNNTEEIIFINKVLIKTGSKRGGLGEECSAIDIYGNVKDITFKNTYIYDAQHDALHLGSNIKNIIFDNLVIFETGTEEKSGQ